ncbi:ABC transporter substrate-binding protein [Brevirhabdus sp.]|uniref:ABC transporter substrate-binding protein n=1 Tax=Brevirhabdus sp. TaxID=2004514 RepID=UPI0040598B74
MTRTTINGKPLHPAVAMYADEHRAGQLDRREFLARASALGATSATAYALAGIAPATAQPASATPRRGGTLRIQTEVRALKDPRTYDWSQIANFSRGWLEYLVEYNRDGTFRGMLLDSWEVNEDATRYTLNLRPDVTWNNGDKFTAEDVVRILEYWCDKTVEGNSMAGRMATLIDPDTNRAIQGAIKATGALTVTLDLPKPDISIIPGMADYPAAVVHKDHDPERMIEQALGTGPYVPETLEVGVKAVLRRNTDHDWWGDRAPDYGGATLERIEYIDYGTDPSAWVAAAEAGEVDMLYETVGDFVEIMDSTGWNRSEVVTAATITIRPNQQAEVDGIKPYADPRVRRALQMAVQNAVCLELGYADRGIVAANHHVCPIHPEYADIGAATYDPAAALELLEDARMADFEHELISIDDDWRKNTTDAVAAQLRDAGIKVKRTILPGSTFWNGWLTYPFSSTNWNMRPLGVQVLALAYRTGEAWNESAFSNAEFDTLLNKALSIDNVDKRREVMVRIEEIMQQEGVVIQPYWRSLYRHYADKVIGAEMHPTFEIHPYRLGLAA